MKNLLLALLIPCSGFACQSCIDAVREKIDETSVAIIRIEQSYIDSEELLIYLYGRLDGQYDMLRYFESLQNKS